MAIINFGRVITAMVTPFAKDGSIDYEAVEVLVNHLIQSGSQSIVVSGTTGESPTLTEEEKITLFQTVKRVADGRVKIIANVGSNDTMRSVAFAKQVEAVCEPDGFLLVNPYYNKPSQGSLYAHFSTIAENVSTPIMLYNIPSRTGVNLEAETTIALSQIPNIVAIKESSGDLDQMATIIEGTEEDFRLYSGDDNLTLPILSIGGYGVVSVASHVVGPAMREMIANHDARLHRLLLPLFQAIFIDTNPIGIKYLLHQNGLLENNVRLPLVDTTEQNKRILMSRYIETIHALKDRERVYGRSVFGEKNPS